MDTLNLHSHFENLLYVGRSVLTNTSSRIRRLFFKNAKGVLGFIYFSFFFLVPFVICFKRVSNSPTSLKLR